MEFLMTNWRERQIEWVKQEVLQYNSNNNDIVCEASEVEVSWDYKIFCPWHIRLLSVTNLALIEAGHSDWASWRADNRYVWL